MAEAIVGPLVSKLQELTVSEGRALVAVSGEISRLRDKLMWLLAFLQEADPRRRARPSELMRVLVRQTRDTAFSAEDAVDEYASRVDLSRYPEWSRAAVGFLAGATTQLLFRHRLSGQIAAINARLEEIIENKDKYRLEDSAGDAPSSETWTASAASSSVSQTWGTSKPQIIGRQDEQSKLQSKLLSDTPHLVVIYVVGESGVGRTMLVDSIYQKSTIRDHFEVSAMVKVHKEGVSNILRLICDSLKRNTHAVQEHDDTKQADNMVLHNHLARRRYLVVIDGRQMSVVDWKAVIHELPKEKTQSRVVLITQKRPPFLNRPNHFLEEMIKLEGLQYKGCEELFHRGMSKPQIIGRQDEQSELQKMLLSSTPHLVVIYVVGESGVSRTMLVDSIYQESTIRDHFEVSAVVKVHKEGVSNILRLICDSLKRKTHAVQEHDDTEQADNMVLHNHLTGRRYLLVIDGRQMSVVDWKAVIHALPKEETQSRVVLITKETPPFLNDPNHYLEEMIKLEGLQYKDCEELFHKRLRGNEEAERIYTRRYYRRIHNITGGLPLAVILLSGIMHNKEFPNEWDNVFKYLESAKLKRLDKILSLSFDDLHSELKLCFLYFTAFLEVNNKAYRSTLVKLWAAEGFLAPRDGKTAEQLGQIYLNQLIARGLVAEATSGDKFRPLALHGSVYSFARSEAQEAGFMEAHEGDHVPEPATVRRLTLQNSMDRYAALDNTVPKLRSIIAIFQEETAATATVNPDRQQQEDLLSSGGCCLPFLCSGKQNRSLNISPKFVVTKLLQGSKFLRVIMLEGLEMGSELPEAIGGMVHLCYLGVRCRSLRTIHASIGNLSNLQTMDVIDSSVSEVPPSFWKITSLRHVSGDRLVVPRHTGELKQLSTLSSVRAPRDWDGQILARMVNLKILDVTIEGGLGTQFSDNLSKLNHLTDLTLEGDGLPASTLFTGLSLQRLKTMRLTGSLLHGAPPLPRFHLPNLSDLSLSKTQLDKSFIRRLGELPSLTKLALIGVSYEAEGENPGQLVFQRVAGFHWLWKLAVGDTAISVLIEEQLQQTVVTHDPSSPQVCQDD